MLEQALGLGELLLVEHADTGLPQQRCGNADPTHAVAFEGAVVDSATAAGGAALFEDGDSDALGSCVLEGLLSPGDELRRDVEAVGVDDPGSFVLSTPEIFGLGNARPVDKGGPQEG